MYDKSINLHKKYIMLLLYHEYEVSLYHKTLMLNLILYSSDITDIIQLILLCHLHIEPLFKDTKYSSLISVVTTHCVRETYWKVFM